jgi:signal transduction histidine kinase
MNVVSIQAQVLRRRIEHGHRVEIDDVRAIEASARQAMTELRDMLGALRPSGEPAPPTSLPSVDHLPRLIEECRQAGQDVELEVVGTPREMSTGHSLTAFRIAQECLTNARRHGALGPVRLTLGWEPDHLQITAINPSRVARGRQRFVDGIGLAGMRERVNICGGQLDVGPCEPGVWVVRASLPTSATS